jgi:drug/metabolite transporter (DMT)-like permease
MATLMGWMKFRERPELRRLSGALMIVVGVVMSIAGPFLAPN